jgi:hypothetical protein
MTTTIVVWNAGTPDQEAVATISNKAEEMQVAGKTNNEPTKVRTDSEIQVTRTWTTLADAGEWIAFVEQYGPVSATIQS